MRESFIIANLAAADHIDIPIYNLMLYNTYYNHKEKYLLHKSFLDSEQIAFLNAVERCDGECEGMDYTDGTSVVRAITNCGMRFGQEVKNEVALRSIRDFKYDTHDMFNSVMRIYDTMVNAEVFEKHNASIAMIVMSSLLLMNGDGCVVYDNGNLSCTDEFYEYEDGVSDKVADEYVAKIVEQGYTEDDACELIYILKGMEDDEFYIAVLSVCDTLGVNNTESVIEGIYKVFKTESTNRDVWESRIKEVLDQSGNSNNRVALIALEFVIYAYSIYY